MSAKAIKKLAIGPRKGQLLLPKRAEATRLSPRKKEERMSDAERVAAGQTAAAKGGCRAEQTCELRNLGLTHF
ncbi:hypothetical protein SGRA_3454 [Saprospira grandis str. Lewin]|uniref:Uncharacterized protein n=1 Tax=Saprospira grandis (strain Lewin) TaxID=984262 RepID=H6L1V1_SAPGL|nr:hypothetical protein SGRA_3454 [Saprospira grandis str. Lewin]